MSFLIPYLAFFAMLVPCTVFPASLAASPEQDAVIDQLKVMEHVLKDLRREQAILDKLQGLQDELRGVRQEIRDLRGEMNTKNQPATAPPKVAQPSAKPAKPDKVDVALGDGPKLGEAKATVGIVEFTDFQCPFCKKFHTQTFPQLKTTYIDTGKIQYLVRDYPLDFHDEAIDAAVAAQCAGQQGRYWSMHHELFLNQKRLGPELYQELGKGQNLDVPKYLACLKDPAQAKAVEADLEYAQSIGVRGTPNFFIGRIQDGKLVTPKRIAGARTFRSFKKILDSLLP